VAGIDEVGRGCLFGPVVAAAVILDPGKTIRGLDDSKKLDARTREVLAQRIHDRAVAVAVAGVDSAAIDCFNIYQATRRAMRQAVLGLCPGPDALLVDAMTLETPLTQRSLIHGDARSRSIAAASIIAKVTRDGWIDVWDRVYPGYGLASNKGYGTPEHLAALKRLGPTPQHRLSFQPVAEAACFEAHWTRSDAQSELPLLAGLPVLRAHAG
jgi:ribonuclease HII